MYTREFWVDSRSESDYTCLCCCHLRCSSDYQSTLLQDICTRSSTWTLLTIQSYSDSIAPTVLGSSPACSPSAPSLLLSIISGLSQTPYSLTKHPQSRGLLPLCYLFRLWWAGLEPGMPPMCLFKRKPWGLETWRPGFPALRQRERRNWRSKCSPSPCYGGLTPPTVCRSLPRWCLRRTARKGSRLYCCRWA